MTGRMILIFTLGFLYLSPFTLAQRQAAPEKQGIYGIVRDADGEKMEGYLRLGPEELTVQSKDNQGKNVPVKYIRSIPLEKIGDEIPGAPFEPT